jgi:hypothetical protein
VVTRGDAYLTDTSRVAVRYIRSRPDRLIPNAIQDNQRLFTGRQESGTVSYFTGRSAWTAETRFGINYAEVNRLDDIYTRGIPGIVGSLGFSSAGETVQLRGTTTTIEQVIALPRGNHQVKFGGIYGLKRTNAREHRGAGVHLCE